MMTVEGVKGGVYKEEYKEEYKGEYKVSEGWRVGDWRVKWENDSRKKKKKKKKKWEAK